MEADLQSMKTAQAIARELPAESLDMVLFTAGIMAGKKRTATVEGIEVDLAVSYLNRYVMLHEIAPRLGASRLSSNHMRPRVFVWGFPGTDQRGDVDDFNSERRYSFTTAHSNTVIGNEVLVLDAARRYSNANVYGINPGLIRTGIRSAILKDGSLGQRIVEPIIGALFPDVERYAELMLPLLLSKDIEAHSGAMFGNKAQAIEASPSLMSGGKRQRVLSESDRLARMALGTQAINSRSRSNSDSDASSPLRAR
jgi:NAD(P)-dependent dehydrogenase (short-subunit alcohol dehydrogenase family)